MVVPERARTGDRVCDARYLPGLAADAAGEPVLRERRQLRRGIQAAQEAFAGHGVVGAAQHILQSRQVLRVAPRGHRVHRRREALDHVAQTLRVDAHAMTLAHVRVRQPLQARHEARVPFRQHARGELVQRFIIRGVRGLREPFRNLEDGARVSGRTQAFSRPRARLQPARHGAFAQGA